MPYYSTIVFINEIWTHFKVAESFPVALANAVLLRLFADVCNAFVNSPEEMKQKYAFYDYIYIHYCRKV
jgi:hypothetical protein